MIARIWHGKTKVTDYQTYTDFLKQVAIPDYEKTAGFEGLTFLRVIENDEGHFTLITYWKDIEAIKYFAGDEYQKAKYYPEDAGYLIEFEEKAQHQEVFSRQ